MTLWKTKQDIKDAGVKMIDFLRKPTTPIHIAYGLACAFLCYAFGFIIGFAMMVGFALWEVWNDKNEGIRQGAKYKAEGDMDFWESIVGFTTGMIILAILQSCQVVNISWLAGVV